MLNSSFLKSVSCMVFNFGIYSNMCCARAADGVFISYKLILEYLLNAPEDNRKIIAGLLDLAAKNEKMDNQHAGTQERSRSAFMDIIQHKDPEALLERLHQLIDGKRGADVGCVLFHCILKGFLTRRPTQKEFKSEFTLLGAWSAIHNYMDENNENALDRANKIVVF